MLEKQEAEQRRQAEERKKAQKKKYVEELHQEIQEHENERKKIQNTMFTE